MKFNQKLQIYIKSSKNSPLFTARRSFFRLQPLTYFNDHRQQTSTCDDREEVPQKTVLKKNAKQKNSSWGSLNILFIIANKSSPQRDHLVPFARAHEEIPIDEPVAVQCTIFNGFSLSLSRPVMTGANCKFIRVVCPLPRRTGGFFFFPLLIDLLTLFMWVNRSQTNKKFCLLLMATE